MGPFGDSALSSVSGNRESSSFSWHRRPGKMFSSRQGVVRFLAGVLVDKTGVPKDPAAVVTVAVGWRGATVSTMEREACGFLSPIVGTLVI